MSCNLSASLSRDFDIGSILRPTPIKAESVRRAGEPQEAVTQALPIHSLHTPDLAALQGSQGIATSLSVLHNDIQKHAWQHLDGASQQNGAGPHSAAPQLGTAQEDSQQEGATQTSNGARSQHGAHVSRPFDQRFGSSQQCSQQGSQSWDAGPQQIRTDSNAGSQQQARPSKRKLPFSMGIQPDAKRQSPGLDVVSASHQDSQDAAAEGVSVRPKNGGSAFVLPQKSPVGHSKAQLMSPSLLLVAQQESPTSFSLSGQQTARSPGPVLLGPHAQGNTSQWSPVSAMLH